MCLHVLYLLDIYCLYAGDVWHVFCLNNLNKIMRIEKNTQRDRDIERDTTSCNINDVCYKDICG